MKPQAIAILLGLLLFLAACSDRHRPAQVLSLNTNIAQQQALTEISGNTYEVQQGDTLFAIAFYSGNDYRDIARWNQLPAPFNIFPGQTLRITKPSSKNKPRNNKQLSSNVQKPTKVAVDAKKSPAYGGTEHRKKHFANTLTSNKPNSKLRWAWPAKGQSQAAVVGSDGSNRGLDIRGRLNAPIYAAADGKVVYAGNALKGYGNLIIIKHNNDYLSAYAHNEKILVNEQLEVKQGQKIATMGQTGTTQVMLHFEIRKRGKSLDPQRYLPKS